ncbi:hypothetical protein Pint_02148 [Pistacia integerrima]|uniref:Uncharacterized protein n=1 Tax=Pistacia integerrima TaxID=434235 RepID=A0ACC0ZPN3_9ROSI|nr:hypothetical protein Pint_02148 [Pistacia integerrima]
MFRNKSREFFQLGSQVMHGSKDQASRSDSGCTSSCSSEHVSRFSEASKTRNRNNVSKGSDANKLKQAEESLRTVMYLSCWGPN